MTADAQLALYGRERQEGGSFLKPAPFGEPGELARVAYRGPGIAHPFPHDSQEWEVWGAAIWVGHAIVGMTEFYRRPRSAPGVTVEVMMEEEEDPTSSLAALLAQVALEAATGDEDGDRAVRPG